MSLAAVLITHVHADHIFGIDDLRSYGEVLMFSSPHWISDIHDRFPHIFGQAVQVGGGLPQLRLRPVESAFEIPIPDAKLTVVPIPIVHGRANCYGYRFGNLAYLTDCSSVPDSSLELLRGTELLVMDASSLAGTKGHFSVGRALEVIGKVRVKRAWITHISHRNSHEEIAAFIRREVAERPELAGMEIAPAFDGLVIEGVRLE
jgi:phosphoribosyl 1,2-cyclic phosphate phosphodiesterase